jgi:hypothetical protein
VERAEVQLQRLIAEDKERLDTFARTVSDHRPIPFDILAPSID